MQLFHGMEALTEGKLNESINNVFRSTKSQKKEKDAKQQPLQSSINTSKEINSKKASNANGKENFVVSNYYNDIDLVNNLLIFSFSTD